MVWLAIPFRDAPDDHRIQLPNEEATDIRPSRAWPPSFQAGEKMTSDRDLDLKALLSAIMDKEDVPLESEEPEPPLSEFGLRLAAAVQSAVEQLIQDGSLEVEASEVEALIQEVTAAGLESNSPKHLIKKVLKTLLHSDRVEEIYGTDEMLKATLGKFLGVE